ncbi:hypothetical protein FHS96_001522 [Sphingomonas zeicaulis]|uniref:HupE/UreJ family protein n=1 Tax=Sphingomonas zeicaulis TaxID=1632740 RepID=UPI003D1A1FAF
MVRLIAALFAALVLASPAAAHLTPNSEIELEIGQRDVVAEIAIPLSEVEYAMGRRFAVAPDGTLGAGQAQIIAYVRKRLMLSTSDARWRVASTGFRTVDNGGSYDVHLKFRATPPAGRSPRRFDLDYRAVIDAVPSHFVLVLLRSDYAGGAISHEPELLGGLRSKTTVLHINRGAGSAWNGFASSIGLGMQHIAEGHDHLLFLLALLLPAPVVAAAGRWTGYAGVRGAARKLFRIVTAFTIGHSVTLIGGAFFGWQLPAQPVEVLIALSILVSAAHAFRPIFPGREAIVAAGFGLIHGLAFATLVGNYGLDPWQKAQSILGFNLGIELVQLLVVACVMPALMLLARARAYPPVRLAGAGFSAIAASAWLIERLFGTSNILASAIDSMLVHAPWLILALTLAAVAVFWSRRRTLASM